MSSLPNLRNLAYSILKNLGDEIVNGKEFAELGKCSQCDKEILSLNFEAFTVLSCGHVYHRRCIEKNFLLTQRNKCLFPGCTATVEAVISERRFSVSSHSSTSSIVRRMSNQLQINSPVIQEEVSNQQMDVDVNGEEEMPEEDDDGEEVETIPLRSTQPEQSTSISSSSKGKKRTRESSASTDKSSSKKAKKTGGKKKVSSTLKQLIEELLTDIPDGGRSLEEIDESASNFLQLSERIDHAETKNEEASRGLIFSYFNFGEAVFKRYKKLKPEFGKDGSEAIVKKEVRVQFSRQNALMKLCEKRQRDPKRCINFLIP